MTDPVCDRQARLARFAPTMKVGPRIRAVREAKSLSQEYVAAQLDVVHTTVHMYEKAEDLKSATIKRLGEILEVNHAYLTGDVPDLEGVPVEHVVRREALRLFAERFSLPPTERRQFDRIRDHRLAPVTVERWGEFRKFIRQLLGRPPEEAPISPSTPESSGADQPPPSKKRMAHVTAVTVNERLRRVG